MRAAHTKSLFVLGAAALAAAVLLGGLGVFAASVGCSRLWLGSSGCPRPTRLAELYPALVHLPETTTVKIEVGWYGLAEVSPLIATYSLNRNGDEFDGPGEFTAEKLVYRPPSGTEQISPTEVKASTTLPIGVPTDLIEAFLTAGSRIPMVLGEYKPRRTHTDDYPYLKVEVPTEQGSLRIETASQPAYSVDRTHLDRTPWAIRYRDLTYIVTVDDLDKTWDRILEHLRYRDTVQELDQQLSVAP